MVKIGTWMIAGTILACAVYWVTQYTDSEPRSVAVCEDLSEFGVAIMTAKQAGEKPERIENRTWKALEQGGREQSIGSLDGPFYIAFTDVILNKMHKEPVRSSEATKRKAVEELQNSLYDRCVPAYEGFSYQRVLALGRYDDNWQHLIETLLQLAEEELQNQPK